MAQAHRSNAESEADLAAQLGLSARRLKLLLAQNVSAARQRAGHTQRELANLAELSRATVNLVEAGICDPRLSTITRLAEALHMDTMDLLANEASSIKPHAELPPQGNQLPHQ